MTPLHVTISKDGLNGVLCNTQHDERGWFAVNINLDVLMDGHITEHDKKMATIGYSLMSALGHPNFLRANALLDKLINPEGNP